MDIDISSKIFSNLTKEECNALYNLRDNPNIIACEREDYLKEVSKQLEGKDVYEEVQNNRRILVNTIIRALEKIRI